METEEKTRLIEQHMAYTTGSTQMRKHHLGIDYTDGMHYVAEICGAHWLLDLIASHQPTIRRKHPELHGFQLWILTKNTDDPDSPLWIIDAWSDTPTSEHAVGLATQEIQYSDFPDGLLPFEFYVENNTALLKEER
jgi:hypothetical protein